MSSEEFASFMSRLLESDSGGSGEESEIIIYDSSDNEYGRPNHPPSGRRSNRARQQPRSISCLVNEAIRLLQQAEERSRPERFREEGGPVYKYDFSSQVTGSDLFRDRDMAELIEVVSTLKTRLSAERVFSLGCPQLQQERQVFDELLMRYSVELLETEQPQSSASLTNLPNSSHAPSASTSRTEDIARPGGSNESVMPQSNASHSQDGANNETIDQVVVHTAASGSGVGSTPPSDMQDRINSDENPTSSSIALDANLPSLQEFCQNVKDLTHLTDLTPENIARKFYEPAITHILQSFKKTLAALVTTSNAHQNVTSPRQRKRKRSDSADAVEDKDSECEKNKKSKREQEGEAEEDEDSCSICLEPWSTGGDHRVTCLQCGHLFGLSCIMKWVEQAQSCPQCKAPAKKKDMRNLFVRKITAEDTSQRDRAVRLLEEEKTVRRTLERKEAVARQRLEIQTAENETMRRQLTLMSQMPASDGGLPAAAAIPTASSSSSSQSCSQASSNKRYHLFHRLSIAQDNSCRVFDCCHEMGMMVVSQKASNTLFRGFGIKILSRDFRMLSYQPLHSAVIRDMSFQPGSYEGMLLTGSMDKTVQITSVFSRAVVQKYTLNGHVWCCTWNTQNPNLFYVGMERGVVQEFDIRRTDSHVQEVLNAGGSPISSLHYWNGGDGGGNNNFQGLLIAQLRNLVFKERVNDEFTTHLLPPPQASLMSVSLHPCGKFLSSFRGGASNVARNRYEVCELHENNAGLEHTVTSTRKAMWDGCKIQPMISRNALISKPESVDNELLAVTANHFNDTVKLWDFNKQQEFQTLPCFEKALDIKAIPARNGRGDLLGVLTDKEMMLYTWRE